MSLQILLEAVRDELIDSLTFPEGTGANTVTIQNDEQPPPFSGQEHIVVYPTEWSAEEDWDANTAIIETYGVGIAVTRRSPFAPWDRRNAAIFRDTSNGFVKRLNEIRLVVVSCAILERANAALVEAEEIYLYGEKLRWLKNDPAPEVRGSEWFFSQNEGDTGLVMRSLYGGAKRGFPI